jgi:hypothetical protein
MHLEILFFDDLSSVPPQKILVASLRAEVSRAIGSCLLSIERGVLSDVAHAFGLG